MATKSPRPRATKKTRPPQKNTPQKKTQQKRTLQKKTPRRTLPATAATAPNFMGDGFDLPKVEEKVLSFWDERHIFEKSLAQRKGAKEFVFYEGPPYANGKPAIHHVISRIVKDVVLRYKTMQGFRVPRRAGWDTHGLPVEMAAEKALGFKTKRDIEHYGVKKFNEAAREQVWIYKDEWERMTRRIGYWLDLKNAYVTYAPEYIESIWWTMAKIHERGLLYKGHKVVPWCTRCGTALSSHELAQGYKEVKDTSVYVEFKLKPGQKIGNYLTNNSTYILSWTTTPWTLPGNVALAIGEKIDYAIFDDDITKGTYIASKEFLGAGFPWFVPKNIRVIQGSQLLGLHYEELFKIPALQSPRSYKIYPADFVTTTEGTGVVHTAVMYGEDDYALGKKEGLPEHHTVDDEGKFTKDVTPLAGMYVKAQKTEDEILKYLGPSVHKKEYIHEYPHCWRCGTPVLYYARTSWFIAMAKLRKELRANNEGVYWQPAHIKEGRFGEWLKEAKDWNLSRERYWGAPLPIWECRTCGHTEVIGSLAALDALAGGAKNRYWTMRHGEAKSNTLNVLDSGQRKDLTLTPRGRKEAERAAKAFAAARKKRKETIDLIIHSGIARTSETAEIARKALGLSAKECIADPRLEEIHLGPSLTGLSIEKYRERFPSFASRFAERPEGGESVRDVRARAWKFLEECERKYEGKHILIVSHEYTIWALAQTAEGWSERRAIEEMAPGGEKKKAFIGFAEVRPLRPMTVPRNDEGEIDLHRPFADAIALPCPHCANAGAHGAMHRVREVADVWYDSGAMPYGQVHFPFEGGAAHRAPARSSKNGTAPATLPFPADYIAEGMDQTRGWFYTLMAIATALGYGAPYRNVVVLGLINDKFGQKMSKSKGNVVEPFAVIDKYGVDALRWYFFTGSPLGEPKNFDEGEIAKAFRRTHLIVYNSFVFWKTYADRGAKLSPAIVAGTAKPAHVLDRWILARLAETSAAVTAKLDAYEIREAALALDALVDDLSRWYIRRSRRRLQKAANAADYKAASATLRHALQTVVTMMAPFTPFFSEALYGAMGGAKESVHLASWPVASARTTARGQALPAPSKKLIDAMAAVRTYAALGLAKRAEAGIKVRQPLASMTIPGTLGKELDAILADEVNVKKIAVNAKAKAPSLDTAITPELREEGLFRDAVRMFQELRQKAALAPKDRIVAMMALPASVARAVVRHEKAFMAEIGAARIETGRAEKFDAEMEATMDGEAAWVAIRKI